MIINPTGSPIKGAKVNGSTVSKTIATGNTINAGDFVSVSGSNVCAYNGTIYGVAKKSGTAGQTIAVYVP